MKTLLQINVIVNSGSTGRIAEEIGQTAIANGWKSYIAYGRNNRPSQSNLIKIGNNINVKMHGLLTRLFDRHGFGSKSDTLKLLKKINKIQPDIIHLHVVHGYYINIDILFNYLASANIPVVWTFHDCWAFTGHCTNFYFVGCNKWKIGCFACPQKNEYPSSLLMDNSINNYKKKNVLFNSIDNLTIVPVSKWTHDQVNKSFLNKYPMKIIYNGVNLDVFSPSNNRDLVRRNLGVGTRFMMIGVASDWSFRKGFDDFIKLSLLIDESSIIILVGVSEKNNFFLPMNVIGIPKTEDVKQLAEIYSAADLFLNLTYEDNFPTTNIESLACGTPVLTYETGGSIEAVSSDTGFIVKKGDLSTVIDVIKIVKKKGRNSYSKACRNRAERLYNKDDRYNEYINLYENLIEK